MFEERDGGGAASVVTRFSALVDELQSIDWTCLPGDELLGVLRDLERQKRRLAPVDHALISEVDSRGLAHEHACASTAVLLRQLLRVNPGEAAARVKAAGSWVHGGR